MSDIDNGQHWLDRNRPPRVQITYDVELGDAVEKKELPLVVGVLSDLDGIDNKVVADQHFQEIDRDNFNQLLKDISPSVTIALKASTLMAGDPAAEARTVKITFEKFDDFNPIALLKKVPELKELYLERQRLRDMLARLDGNASLGKELDGTFEKVRLAAGQGSTTSPGAAGDTSAKSDGA